MPRGTKATATPNKANSLSHPSADSQLCFFAIKNMYFFRKSGHLTTFFAYVMLIKNKKGPTIEANLLEGASSLHQTQSDKRRFTPGPNDRLWIFTRHYAALERRLRIHGSAEDVKEAIAEAIAKVLGDHPRLALEMPLVDVTESELVSEIYWQARSILSHMNERAERLPLGKYQTFAEVLKAIDETLANVLLSERQRRIRLSGLYRLMHIMVIATERNDSSGGIHFAHGDHAIVRRELVSILDRVFAAHHIKPERRKAFLDAFFTDKSSRQRAEENGMTVSSVDVSKNQLLKLLRTYATFFSCSSILADYFPFIHAA